MSPDATSRPSAPPPASGASASRRSWRRLGRHRPVPRPRRTVGPRLYGLARRSLFRFSRHRGALVLRGVGARHGPVLVRRGAPSTVQQILLARPLPAPRRRPRDRAGVTLDIACLPLPHLPQGRPVWQLTGVEAHTGCAWANLLAPKGGRPSVAQIDAFVARIGAAMAERGERLTAVTVQVGSALPSAALRSLQAAGIEVRRTSARPADRSAIALHGHFIRRHWRPLAEERSDWDLRQLERELQEWIGARNLEALALL